MDDESLQQPIYQRKGFANRKEYLEDLCESYPREAVYGLASVLGPNEDFDALVTELDDYSDVFLEDLTPPKPPAAPGPGP